MRPLPTLITALAASSSPAAASPLPSSGAADEVAFNPALHFTRDSPSSPLRLLRRLAFTLGGTQDYCGETFPTSTFGAAAPLAADCAGIAAAVTSTPGFFTLEPADFANATTDGWATLVSRGTCAFAVALQEHGGNGAPARLGTNDIRFYIQSYVGEAQGGRIQSVGGISCYNGDKLVPLNWAMLHN
jgi:hypothetical protein